MSVSKKTAPQRADSHQINARGSRIFTYNLPAHWSEDPASQSDDYGEDYSITIARNQDGDKSVTDSFAVQLKSVTKATFVRNGQFVKMEDFRVATLTWLLSRPHRVMLALCDLDSERVYWMWADEVERSLLQRAHDWSKNETVTLHLPVTQVLDRNDISSLEKVEMQIREYRAQQRVSGELFRVLEPSLGFTQDSLGEAYVNPEKSLIRHSQLLQEVGLVNAVDSELDTSLSPRTADDVRRHGKLRDVAALLRGFQADAALELLQSLEPEMSLADRGVRASFYHARGVATAQLMNLQGAIADHEAALALKPDSAKIMQNLLAVRLMHHEDTQTNGIADEWVEAVSALLVKAPDSVDLLRLKARFVSARGSTDDAIALLQKSIAKGGPEGAQSLMTAVEILSSVARHSDARRLIVKVDPDKLSASEQSTYWATRGFLELQGALGDVGTSIAVMGYGPPDMVVDDLFAARGSLERGYTFLQQKGLPIFGDVTVCNYGFVLLQLGEFDEALRVVDAFIFRHPNYHGALSLLKAWALSLLGRHREARDINEIEVKSNPYHALAFRNLLGSLYELDDFAGIVTTVNRHAHSADISVDDRSLAFRLLGEAYIRLQDYDGLTALQDSLRGEPQYEVVLTLLEVQRLSQADPRSSEVLSKLRKSSEHFAVKEILAQRLDFRNRSEAIELLTLLDDIRRTRSLYPEEVRKYARSLITCCRCGDAVEFLRAGIARFGSHTELHECMVEALCQSEEWEEALCAVERLKTITSTAAWSAHYNHSVILANLGRFDIAQAVCRQAIACANSAERQALARQLLSDLEACTS